MSGFGIFVVVLLGAVVLIAMSNLKVVPQGHEYIVERLGRYSRTLQPGLNFIVPFIERISTKHSLAETVLEVPSQELATVDKTLVMIGAVVAYRIVETRKAAYQVISPGDAVVKHAAAAIATIAAMASLDELKSQPDRIAAQVLSLMDHETAHFGVKVTGLELKDVAPSAP